MTEFTINKKSYTAAPFDFNLICNLEDMGISLEKIADKPMAMLKAYFALSAKESLEFAGKEIESHIINGGSFDEICNAMNKEIEESDFFQNLSKKSAEEITEAPSEE